jgi:NAD+ kinase
MQVAIYCRKITKQELPLFQRFFHCAQRFNWQIVLHEELKTQLLKKGFPCESNNSFSSYADFQHGNIDMVFSIGGDGTFLKTVTFIRDSNVPIIGINTGRLGFLANVNELRLEQAMELIHQKKFQLQARSLLRVHTDRKLFGEDNFALNEVTILKKDASSMITVHAHLGEDYLNSYWVDGLIVSTTTGSTAYNLSCGGPLVAPGCRVHVLTPIAPHNLNVRPIVVPDDLSITLSVEGRERNYLLSLDGNTLNIKQKEQVTIEKADFFIQMIKLEGSNFLTTIRNKMLWGKDRRN